MASQEFGYDELQRAALAFVLESQTWPDFLAWIGPMNVSKAIHDWLASQPDRNELRREWMRHSPQPELRALADDLADD